MREDREAKERFCASAWPTLVAAMTHYCDGDVHLAEELAQEALVRACRRWPHVASLDSPVGWTYRVAVNLANSRFRRLRAERRALERHGPARQSQCDADVGDRLAVRDALADLTPKQREAVVLRYFLDLSANQTAQLMGATAGSVRALTHRAVARLRPALDVTVPDREAIDVP